MKIYFHFPSLYKASAQKKRCIRYFMCYASRLIDIRLIPDTLGYRPVWIHDRAGVQTDALVYAFVKQALSRVSASRFGVTHGDS